MTGISARTARSGHADLNDNLSYVRTRQAAAAPHAAQFCARSTRVRGLRGAEPRGTAAAYGPPCSHAACTRAHARLGQRHGHERACADRALPARAVAGTRSVLTDVAATARSYPPQAAATAARGTSAFANRRGLRARPVARERRRSCRLQSGTPLERQHRAGVRGGEPSASQRRTLRLLYAGA